MAVRQTFQFNAPSGNGGGVILGEPSDIKGRRLAGGLPWLLDMDATNRVRLGDTVAGGRSGISAPVVPYGGFGVVGRSGSGTIVVTPDDAVIYCNTSGGSVTVQLPPAASMVDQILDVVKLNTGNTVTILPNGAELVDNQASYSFGGFRQPVRLISDGTGWVMLLQAGRITTVLNNYNFSFSTTSASPTTVLTSASLYFTGRPVLFLLSCSMRDVNGFDEFMIAPQYLQFDGAGTNHLIADWTTNVAEDHKTTSGSILITPSNFFQGNHTVSWRTNRGSGVGTLTMDTNDFVTLVAIEL